jgi:hypothetical protein
MSGTKNVDHCFVTMPAALRTVGLAAAVLALSACALALAQESAVRSSGELRRWPVDERQQPRYLERATHHGFEVSTGPIHVVATTNWSDAHLAAELALAGWNKTAALADHWTSVHRQANFAQGAVQLIVDSKPERRDQRPAAVTAVGQTSLISINVATGQPTLEKQQGQLRQAAALAFLHTAELDRQLPQWVCQGLAAYAGKMPADDEGEDALPTEETSVAQSFGIGQRPRQRVASDRLAEPDGEENEAAQLVQFLVEGNDARHAAEFFDCLREHLATSRPVPDRNFQRKNDPSLPAVNESDRLNQFVAALAQEYEQWKADPQIGQPYFKAAEGTDNEFKQGQQEMLFILKLVDRFAQTESAAIRTRITTFEKGRGSATLTGTSATRPPSLRTLVDRFTAEDRQPWATVGPDGELIWSSEEAKLRELLGVEENRYEHVWESDRWVLATRLADGRQLLGWLEPNPENAQRPLAKFSVKASDSAEPRRQPVGQRRAQSVEPNKKLSGRR